MTQNDDTPPLSGPGFKEPDKLQWAHFTNKRGGDIRYGHVRPEGEVKGSVVILPGFRETAEKYYEVMNEMLARGLEVWVMDWRGQGGSQRFVKDAPQRAHNEGYEEHIETLHQFTQLIQGQTQAPLIMMAHSMGAHIGLRYMKENEGVFDSAILSSPMFDIMTGNLPKPLARQMAKFAKAGNYLEKYVPGGDDWRDEKHKFEDNSKTSDRRRFDVGNEIYRQNEDLRIGDPTYGWVYHTFQSIDVLNQEEYLKSIHTPVLMQISDADRVVDRLAQVRAAGILPNCRRVDTPGAGHEIWSEQDTLRNAWLREVDVFLGERLNPPPPAPKKPNPHSAPKGP